MDLLGLILLIVLYKEVGGDGECCEYGDVVVCWVVGCCCGDGWEI